MIALLLGFTLSAWAQVENSDKFIREIESRFAPSVNLKKDVGEAIPRYQYMGIIDREEIIKSKVVQKALKRLGSVQRLKDQKLFGITDRMIVRVFEKTDELDFFYVLGNNNTVSYRVHAKYVEDLALVTALDEPPRQYTEVKVHKNVSPFDRDLAWLHEIAGGLSLGNARWLGDLADDTGLQNGAGFILKGQSLADMGERFRLGASLNLENARHSSSRNAITMQNISVGLIGKTKPIETNNFQWRLSAEFRYSLFGQLSQTSGGAQNRTRFRSTSVSIGWEKLETNFLGPWSWGVNLQRDFPKLVAQDQFVSQNTNETNDSLILQLTQAVNW